MIHPTFIVLKFAMFVFIAYVVINILFSLPVSAWVLLGGLCLTFLIIGFIGHLYRKKKKELVEATSALIPAILTLEKLMTTAIYMTAGIYTYQIWLLDPGKAYTLGAFILYGTATHEYKKRREQLASDNSGAEPPRPENSALPHGATH